MFGDIAETAAHPLVVAVAAPLILATIAGIVAFSRRVLGILGRIEAHVLPHFTLGPGVEPGGQDDHTLPNRAARVETALDGLASDVTRLNTDLRAHMADEATHVRQLHRRIDDALAHPPKE